MIPMKRHLRIDVMVQAHRRNVKMGVLADKLAEGLLYVLSAKGAQFNASLGQRPRIHETQRKAPALKARFTSESFHSIIDAMPQSLSRVIVHIIFSTKVREPWLGSDVRPRMHAYLATVCRDLGA